MIIDLETFWITAILPKPNLKNLLVNCIMRFFRRKTILGGYSTAFILLSIETFCGDSTGEGKWSDEVNKRFGLCCDLIAFWSNFRLLEFWWSTIVNICRNVYWIDRKQSISCRTWIEWRIAGLFGFLIFLKNLGWNHGLELEHGYL